MSAIDPEILNYLWLPPNYYRTTTSGVDLNSIGCMNRKLVAKKNSRYFEIHRLPELRKKATLNPALEKYLPKNQTYAEGFRMIVNDALKQIYQNKQGYVFSESQLVELLRFVPDAKVSYRDDMYFVNK